MIAFVLECCTVLAALIKAVVPRSRYLRKVRAKLESPGARFGFPLSGGGVQPAVTIYAWNEFAEGCIVAPTQGEGWKKLLGIAAVFGAERAD